MPILLNGDIVFACKTGWRKDRHGGGRLIYNLYARSRATGPSDETDVHTAQPIGLDRVMYMLNGPIPRTAGCTRGVA